MGQDNLSCLEVEGQSVPTHFWKQVKEPNLNSMPVNRSSIREK